MSRSALRSAERASWRAKQILIVLSEPDDLGQHTASVDALAQLLRCGRGAVISVLDELEAIGFAVRSEDRRSVELTQIALDALREAREQAEQAEQAEAEHELEPAA